RHAKFGEFARDQSNGHQQGVIGSLPWKLMAVTIDYGPGRLPAADFIIRHGDHFIGARIKPGRLLDAERPTFRRLEAWGQGGPGEGKKKSKRALHRTKTGEMQPRSQTRCWAGESGQ